MVASEGEVVLDGAVVVSEANVVLSCSKKLHRLIRIHSELLTLYNLLSA